MSNLIMEFKCENRHMGIHIPLNSLDHTGRLQIQNENKQRETNLLQVAILLTNKPDQQTVGREIDRQSARWKDKHSGRLTARQIHQET